VGAMCSAKGDQAGVLGGPERRSCEELPAVSGHAANCHAGDRATVSRVGWCGHHCRASRGRERLPRGVELASRPPGTPRPGRTPRDGDRISRRVASCAALRARLSPLDHHPCLSILSDFDRPCTCILHIVERRQCAARSRIFHVPFLVRAGTDTQNSLFMLRMHDDLRATWSIRTGQVLLLARIANAQ